MKKVIAGTIRAKDVDLHSLPSVPINALSPMPNLQGLYLIRDRECMLYIGRARRMKARIKEYQHTCRHLVSCYIPQATVSWIPVSDPIALAAMEGDFIAYFKPALNWLKMGLKEEFLADYLSSLGAQGGRSKSDAKAAAARTNGKKGGRPAFSARAR